MIVVIGLASNSNPEREFFALLGTPHGMYITLHLIINCDLRDDHFIISAVPNYIVPVVI